MTKYSILLLMLPATVIATQADPFVSNLTLQVALEYGAENNPRLQAVFNQWKGLEENISVQKALPDPKLTYGYYFESVQTRTGPQNQKIGLSQTFPGFGKRAAKKAIATHQAAMAGQNFRAEKLNLNLSITQAFSELHYLKRSIAITRERIRLVQDLEQVARSRYKAGADMAPTLQAQLELERLKDQLASLQDLRQPQQAKLNTALNRPADAPLAWPTAIPYLTIEADPKVLKQKLTETSPELARLSLSVRQGEQQIQLAKRERFPDFTLGLQFIETGNASIPASDSGKDPVIGTVGVSLPLWFGKNRARIEAAVHQQTAARLMHENRTQTLEAEIQQVLFKLRDADRKIDLYEKTLIPKAIQSLEVNRKGFEAGRMEFINLIDSQRMLLEFELARERALADHLIALAELSKRTGIDFLTGENHETH